MNQTTQKTLFSRRFVPLIGSVLVCISLSLRAQTNSEDYSLSPDLGQGNAGVTSYNSQACAPTAVANGLAYLYGINPGDFYNINPGTYGTVNTLIGSGYMDTTSAGTTGPNINTGVQNWATANTSALLVNQYSDPTAASLSSALSTDQAVQLGILWGNFSGSTFNQEGGGHFVSLTAMSINSSGSGTITVLDPWGTGNGSTPGTTAVSISLTVSTVSMTVGSSQVSVLDVTYPNDTGSTVPKDNPAATGTGENNYGNFFFDTGIIAIDEVECIPEPSTMTLLAAPLAAGVLRLLRKRRAE
jgi:hypothetical protein